MLHASVGVKQTQNSLYEHKDKNIKRKIFLMEWNNLSISQLS